MIGQKKLLIVITGLLFLCQFGLAQFDEDENVAKFTVFQSYDSIHPGMELRIAVKATIKVLWHINSNEPSEDYMIGTSVEIPAGGTFELKEVIYPEPFELMLGFSDSPVSVYEGEVFIGGVIPVPADIGQGAHKIPIHITYQACNDATCLPPQLVKKEISVVVVDTKTPIKEINKEIFTHCRSRKKDSGQSSMISLTSRR